MATAEKGASRGRSAGLQSKDFREALAREITAENTLITNRMTWALTFQGFLFTGYALALAKEGRAAAQFIATLPYAGIASAGLAMAGMFAAFWQIRVLRKQWKPEFSKYGPRPFSGSVGHLAGEVAPLAMTIVLIWTWAKLA